MRRRRSSPWLADELPGEGVDGFAFVELGVGSALRRSTVTRRGERSSSFNPSLRKIAPEIGPSPGGSLRFAVDPYRERWGQHSLRLRGS